MIEKKKNLLTYHKKGTVPYEKVHKQTVKPYTTELWLIKTFLSLPLFFWLQLPHACMHASVCVRQREEKKERERERERPEVCLWQHYSSLSLFHFFLTAFISWLAPPTAFQVVVILLHTFVFLFCLCCWSEMCLSSLSFQKKLPPAALPPRHCSS